MTTKETSEEKGDAIDALLARLSPEVRKDMKRGSEVVPIPPGHLTSQEVCIIWGGQDWDEPGMDGPSFYAREFVAQHDLPLMQQDDGRWVVKRAPRYDC